MSIEYIASLKVVSHLPLVAILAEASSNIIPDPWSPLINVGAVGCILLWFLIKTEPRLRRLEQAMDRSTRGNMLVIMAVRSVSPEIREQANTLLHELDEAQERRVNP